MSVTGKKVPAKSRPGGAEASRTQLKLVTGSLTPSNGAPQFLTVDEVAAMLRCKPRTIYQMVSQRRIPFRKAGRLLLFETGEIDRWTQESTRK